MRSVLVTGSGGQLGRELVERARRDGWTVTGLGRHEAEPCDITDADAVRALVRAARPDVVIHAAAWTDVDGCEADPTRALAVNAEGTRHVADAAAEVGAHLVYVSTDHVYEGRKLGAYVETDPVGPRSAYGRSKLAGEAALPPGATIARTSWLCGRHGRNVARTVLRLAAGDDPIRFVDDQVGNPTIAADLAPLLLRLGRDRFAGVVHTSNQGTVSWFEFAREVLAAAGLDPERVEPISTAELVPARPAPRPANAALAPRALLDAGYELLPDHRVSLGLLVAQLQAQAHAEADLRGA